MESDLRNSDRSFSFLATLLTPLATTNSQREKHREELRGRDEERRIRIERGERTDKSKSSKNRTRERIKSGEKREGGKRKKKKKKKKKRSEEAREKRQISQADKRSAAQKKAGKTRPGCSLILLLPAVSPVPKQGDVALPSSGLLIQ